MKTKVLTVPVVPFLTAPDICSGIRDESHAREWGEKNAYSQVYYLRGKQRVYADKTSTIVDRQAVEQESLQPLGLSEQGEIDLFDAGLFLLLVLLILAGLRNVPW